MIEETEQDTVPRIKGLAYLSDKLISEVAEGIVEIRERSTRTCPILRVAGDKFYMCGTGLSENNGNPLTQDQIKDRQRGTTDLETYCMNEYEKCGFYKGDFERD